MWQSDGQLRVPWLQIAKKIHTGVGSLVVLWLTEHEAVTHGAQSDKEGGSAGRCT